MLSMALCNYIVSILGGAIGACIMLAASSFPMDFTENGPGPGFWPFALGLALLAAALVLFVTTFFEREILGKTEVRLAAAANKRVYVMMGLAVAFCLLISLLGFYVAAFFLIIAVMRLMDYRKKKGLIITACAALLFIYAVFGLLLHTQLPGPVFLE